jgi:hypothetical protein
MSSVGREFVSYGENITVIRASGLTVVGRGIALSTAQVEGFFRGTFYFGERVVVELTLHSEMHKVRVLAAIDSGTRNRYKLRFVDVGMEDFCTLLEYLESLQPNDADGEKKMQGSDRFWATIKRAIRLVRNEPC